MSAGQHRRPFTFVLVLTLLVLAILTLWPFPAGPAGEGNLGEFTRENDPSRERPEFAGEPVPEVQRSEPEVPQAPPAEGPAQPEIELAVLRGRTLRAEDHLPLEATVKFPGWGSNQSAVAMQGQVDWEDPEPVATDDDGRFEIRFDPPSGFQWSLDVQADRRVPRTGRWGRLERGQVIDVGDFELALGYEVRGRVVDELGVPVEKVGVSLKNLPLPLAPDMAANDARYGMSDENGEFRVEVAIPAGTWSLDVSARGRRLVSPDRVTVHEHVGAQPVTVVVRSMPSISGIVVDDLGEPVERVYIEADLHRSGTSAATYSRKDGTFTLYAVDAEPKPVRIRVRGAGRCEPPLVRDPTLHEWGTKDLRIVLQRALTFELMVIERGASVPVTQYAIQCYNERSLSSLEHELRCSGDHEYGKLTVDQVWHGKNTLVVQPLDPVLLPSDPVVFEATDEGIEPMLVEVDRMVESSVRITNVAGEPVPDAEIEVIEKGTDELTETEHVRDRFKGLGAYSSDPEYRWHELRSRGTTDAAGRTRVFAPSRDRTLAVRVKHASYPTLLAREVTFVPGQEQEFVLQAAGAIHGRVERGSLDASRLAIRLGRRAPDGTRTTLPGKHPIQGDRTFAIEGLAAGIYALTLHYQVSFRSEGGGHTADAKLDIEIPDVVVEAGRPSELFLDVTRFAPARLRARASLDGQPPTAARIQLQREGGPTYGLYVPDEHGAFVAEDLLPGSYTGSIVVGDFKVTHGTQLTSEETFTLAPGQDLETALTFLRRRLVVTVLDADGTPHRDREIRVGWSMAPGSKTDENGRLVLEPVSWQPVALFLPSRDNNGFPMKSLGEVACPQDKREHEVTVRVKE